PSSRWPLTLPSPPPGSTSIWAETGWPTSTGGRPRPSTPRPMWGWPDERRLRRAVLRRPAPRTTPCPMDRIPPAGDHLARDCPACAPDGLDHGHLPGPALRLGPARDRQCIRHRASVLCRSCDRGRSVLQLGCCRQETPRRGLQTVAGASPWEEGEAVDYDHPSPARAVAHLLRANHRVGLCGCPGPGADLPRGLPEARRAA